MIVFDAGMWVVGEVLTVFILDCGIAGRRSSLLGVVAFDLNAPDGVFLF